MDLAFQYFFIAGAGVGAGLVLTILPAILLKEKIQNGGVRVGKKRSSRA